MHVGLFGGKKAAERARRNWVFFNSKLRWEVGTLTLPHWISNFMNICLELRLLFEEVFNSSFVLFKSLSGLMIVETKQTLFKLFRLIVFISPKKKWRFKTAWWSFEFFKVRNKWTLSSNIQNDARIFWRIKRWHLHFLKLIAHQTMKDWSLNQS